MTHPSSYPSTAPSTRRNKIWLFVIAAVVLIVFATVGGIYLGSGAGQGTPVKQDAGSGVADGSAPDMGASAQMSGITGKSPLGGSSSPPPALSQEAGAIVAPGGVELQRPNPVPASSPVEPAASEVGGLPASAVPIEAAPAQPQASPALPAQAEAAASR